MIMKRKQKAIGFFLLCMSIAFIQQAFACRFNVRDIGFVDFGTSPYILYGFVNSDTPADQAESFGQILSPGLADSNIKSAVINIDEQKNHPAVKYLDLLAIKTFPSAVLVSPQGNSITIFTPKPDVDFRDSVWDCVDTVISSPTRTEIEDNIKSFATILLVQGPNESENKTAETAALSAIKMITAQMEFMPKRVEKPPVLITISFQSLYRERILLWSLGLNAEKITQPAVAVLYGRARIMGPVLKGPEITESRIRNFLSITGADCECGLDRKWMEGVMIPFNWDDNMKESISRHLQFDPESPMIKMEIDRILRRGPQSGANNNDPDSYPDLSFGYREIVVDFSTPPESLSLLSDGNEVSGTPAVITEPPIQNPPPTPVAQAEPAKKTMDSYYIFVTIGVVSAVIIVIGFTVLIRDAAKHK